MKMLHILKFITTRFDEINVIPLFKNHSNCILSHVEILIVFIFKSYSDYLINNVRLKGIVITI